MGFLKRFFSLGGKKSRKQKRDIVEDPGLTMDFRYRPATADDETEAAANKLLRSSSARYAVANELDNGDLPPLPHPIDRVLQTPTGSSSSLRSGSFSRGTYKVTVHQKERHLGSTTSGYGSSDSTDNLDEMVTPRPQRRQYLDSNNQDTSGVMRLRSDPSVASLLDLYDDHGRLPELAFSNSSPSPPATPMPTRVSPEDLPLAEGRAQTRRNGSTLRQLLGTPSANRNTGGEGDISWAERFLGEAASSSSVSSFGLETSTLPSGHESHVDVLSDTTFSSDYDRSTDCNPTISSMSVELSVSSDAVAATIPVAKMAIAYEDPVPEPSTPQRASEVFGFLTEKRRSRAPDDDYGRDLPDPPSAFSSPSSAHEMPPSRFSAFSTDTSLDTISVASTQSAIPSPCDTQFKDTITDIFTSHRRANEDTYDEPVAVEPVQSEEKDDFSQPEPQTNKVKVLMTVPTTLMVTAPTPNHHMDRADRSYSRIPRGPRSARKGEHRERRTSSSAKPSLLDRSNSHGPSSSNDKFTAIPSRPRKMQPRRVSSASTSSATSSVSKARRGDKENGSGLGLTAKQELPFTPVRGNSGHRSLLRTAVTPGVFVAPEPPSPNMSAELSPVGQKIMKDARKQRQRFGPRDVVSRV